jgi:hypothetical protein
VQKNSAEAVLAYFARCWHHLSGTCVFSTSGGHVLLVSNISGKVCQFFCVRLLLLPLVLSFSQLFSM